MLEIIIQNLDAQPPSVSELGEWADEYGLTMPVLSDENFVLTQYSGVAVPGLPYTVVIDRGVVIESSKSGAQEDAAVNLLD